MALARVACEAATQMRPIKTIDDPRYVKAMSHPLRVRILAMLGERKASPRQLAQLLGSSLGTTAYHVRTLERLGLIELVEERPVRGAIEHLYRALRRPSVTDEAWASAPPIAKQAAVSSTLQVIDEYARVSAAAGGFDRSDAILSRRLVRLDAKGFAELAKASRRLLEQVERIEARAGERLARDPHAEDAVQAGLGVLLFEAVPLTEGVGEERTRPAARGRGRRVRAR
jgi:DNA-binding transcriptional ArsR family regulator